MASEKHDRWYHKLNRPGVRKIVLRLGILVNVLCVLWVVFYGGPWWIVYAIGFIGVVFLVTYVNQLVLRFLFRIRGKSFALINSTDRAPWLEFLSVMITGCTFVTLLISVVAVIKIRSDPSWDFPYSSVAGLVIGCLIGGGATVFFRQYYDSMSKSQPETTELKQQEREEG
mgnify:CR=1 FL=1|tara:strand:- start:1683 stop:2195 length:513 start_codon:yes stop_codon:yes gene_type:complete